MGLIMWTAALSSVDRKVLDLGILIAEKRYLSFVTQKSVTQKSIMYDFFTRCKLSGGI